MVTYRCIIRPINLAPVMAVALLIALLTIPISGLCADSDVRLMSGNIIPTAEYNKNIGDSTTTARINDMSDNNRAAEILNMVNNDGTGSSKYTRKTDVLSEKIWDSGSSAYGDTLAVDFSGTRVERELQVSGHTIYTAAAWASDAPALPTATPSATASAALVSDTEKPIAQATSSPYSTDANSPTPSPTPAVPTASYDGTLAGISASDSGSGEIETIPDEELPEGVSSASQQIHWFTVAVIILVFGTSVGFSVFLWQKRNARYMRRF